MYNNSLFVTSWHWRDSEIHRIATLPALCVVNVKWTLGNLNCDICTEIYSISSTQASQRTTLSSSLLNPYNLLARHILYGCDIRTETLVKIFEWATSIFPLFLYIYELWLVWMAYVYFKSFLQLLLRRSRIQAVGWSNHEVNMYNLSS